jgi:hypothetical protein
MKVFVDAEKGAVSGGDSQRQTALVTPANDTSLPTVTGLVGYYKAND